MKEAPSPVPAGRCRRERIDGHSKVDPKPADRRPKTKGGPEGPPFEDR
jgi:hypothetical protein